MSSSQSSLPHCLASHTTSRPAMRPTPAQAQATNIYHKCGQPARMEGMASLMPQDQAAVISYIHVSLMPQDQAAVISYIHVSLAHPCPSQPCVDPESTLSQP